MSAYQSFASVYDIFMEEIEYDAWLAHIAALWEKGGYQPKSVLDLGCGTGSILLPLAQQGLDCVGVDLSAEMLAAAEHKAREAGLSVRLACQDMTELELGESFDCILSLCDCMNYLTEDGQLEEALRHIAAHLKKDGIFIFDMNTEYKFRELFGQNTFAAAEDNAAYIWENLYDADEKINEYYVSFFTKQENGLYARTEEFHYERAYSIDEVKAALEASGLELLSVSDGYRFAPPQAESERLLFAAKLQD